MTADKKNQVKSIFSTYADAYATSQTHAKGEDLEKLIEWVSPSSKDVALDIATGGGNVVKKLAPFVSSIFATDLTKDMLQNTSTYLTEFPNVHYVVADAEELPFLDRTFDIVVCRIAAHHFPSPEKFVQEVFRVVKPGGRFLLIDNVSPEDPSLAHFMNTFEEMRDPSHAKALSVLEWKRLFQENGLEIEKEFLSKKELPFQNWVTRTVEDETKISAVSAFFSNASPAEKKYFQFHEQENGDLASFKLDQWMAMATAKHT
ncbi:class I SAM-dependent methyltransferase [Jeotgalibacillus proteolyticus]|uniref:Class I SAM-dependent methyltransferase n=1 Tax=Jeotgalibacillus proteolyticus TaxID=2082395 RepID=A0A2S5GCQ7_9BACL|nr:methyltransferase domain-containing protein [Jeotgalibacillus proteolyticus]PPA70683.1 class I SAM-dependent methyltransferase [Jeotgalibacillus proteolyticus]